ncbi:hypothetical protein E2C01_048371 [Portunus trituberculatus]|uniref:Uncharacterized protein n=1 Tax=Portunus trituberculatus TaxID=210409 RepID=A0A5B7GD66_PORTR|nr:hypothetical protein [Portunus trituberculatus]
MTLDEVKLCELHKHGQTDANPIKRLRVTSLSDRRDGSGAGRHNLPSHSFSHCYRATATARPLLPQSGKPVVPLRAAGKPLSCQVTNKRSPSRHTCDDVIVLGYCCV